MISINLRVRNPFKSNPFRNINNWTWHLFKQKYLELQFSRYAWNCFEFGLDLNWRGEDHAGPWLTVNVLGYTMDLRIYDSRHWDDETDDWAVYEST